VNRYVLKCVDFDGLENRLSNAIYTTRIVLLGVETEQRAKEIASQTWAKLKEKAYVGWDKREYPREPSLVLEIDWELELQTVEKAL
jgi:hypothetical protein